MTQSVLHPGTEPPALLSQGRGEQASPRVQGYVAGVWIFVAALVPLVGFVGARGFAPLVGLAGLLCLPLARPRGADLVGLALVALLVLWAAVSALWSPAPLPRSLHDLGRFTGLHLAQQIALAGAFILATRRLQPAAAAKVLAWLGFGLLLLAGLVLEEAFSDAALYKALQPLVGQKPSAVPGWDLRSVAQGGWVLAVLFWPAAAAFQQAGRLWAALLLAAASLAVLLVLKLGAPLAALLAGSAAFVLVLRGGRRAALALGAGSALASLCLPWLMLGLGQEGLFGTLAARLPRSWAARTDIWSFTAARMAEKPLRGWGLDASRTFIDQIPLHPHDGPLQLWFELGLPGAVLGALVWAFAFSRFAAAPSRRLSAASGCAAAVTCLVIGALSFSLWQEWWIDLCVLGLASAVLVGRMEASR